MSRSRIARSIARLHAASNKTAPVANGLSKTLDGFTTIMTGVAVAAAGIAAVLGEFMPEDGENNKKLSVD